MTLEMMFNPEHRVASRNILRFAYLAVILNYHCIYTSLMKVINILNAGPKYNMQYHSHLTTVLSELMCCDV